jgi:hypothetical protein
MDSTDLKAAIDAGRLVPQTDVSSTDNGEEKSLPKAKRKRRRV